MINVILLGIVSLLADVSSEMVYPLLPLYLASVGAGPAVLGWIEGSSEALASLTKVLSGRRSDRSGRRKPLALAGYALSAVGKALLLPGGWLAILVGRLSDRFGKGIRGAPRDALLAESIAAHQRGRAFGLHRAMDTAGALLGVLIAYVVIGGGAPATPSTYTAVFALAVIPALLSVAVLALVRAPERPALPSAARRPAGLRQSWAQLDGRLQVFLLIALLFSLGNSSNQFLLLRAGQLGVDVGGVLLLYMLYNLVYAALAYPAGRLSDRVGRRALLVAGYATYGIVYLGFALARGPAELVALFGLYGCYTACTEGVEKALLADLAPPELKATLLGLHATIVGLGLLPASVLTGAIWQAAGPSAAFAVGSATGLLAALGLWWALRTPHRPAAGSAVR